MDRRRFLTSTGMGLVATGLSVSASWPSFLTGAFADEGAGAPKARAAELKEAIARARRDGKPLLLFIIPTDPSSAYERGLVFGELINHGGAEVLDDLLLCELACATSAEARAALPLAAGPESEMLLVELDGDGGEFLPATPIDLPARTSSGKRAPEEEDAVRARIALGAAALRDAVRPGAEALARRADRSRAALGAATCAAIDARLAGGGALAAELAQRGAAQVLAVATDGTATPKGRARAALSIAAAAMVKARPPGSQWARTDGCGMTIESDSPRPGVACGMGQVPELSRRFLHFYSTP